MPVDDVRTAKYSKEQPEKGRMKQGVVKQRWWEVEDESERAAAVVAMGKGLSDNNLTRQQTMLLHARMYENADLTSLHGRDYADAVIRQTFMSSGLMTLNVAAACVDTLTAKVTKNHPRPSFQCSGASWDKQIKARNLDKWARGYMYETKVFRHSRQVFVDGCEFGTGYLFLYPVNGKLQCERAIGAEIFVDTLDGQYGTPRQMMRRKFVDRDILKRLYGRDAEKLKIVCDAGKAEMEVDSGATESVAENTVEVWEAWHLPSGKGASDGWHVIAVDGGELYREKWKVECFPFVIYRFKKRTTGFEGKGVVETVQGLQVEINRVVKSLSQQYRRKGKGRTYLPMGSKVVPSHLTNEDGGDIIFYAGGVPPTVDNGNAIAQEDWNYLNLLYQKAFQECGISELSASAKKPSGLDAAVALREYSDIESERFAPQHQDWEQFFVDFIETSIELIKHQYGYAEYKVLVPGRRDLLEVDWKSIDLDRDSYIMQIFSVSSLPQTPSARFQRVEELRAKGYITDPVAKRLLDFPDIEAEENLGNAMIDDVDATISHILDDETPKLMPLEPYQNLDMMIERATASYLYSRHRGCPEERLRLLRNLIDNATKQKAALQTMAQPAMPGAPGAPMPGAPAGAPPAPPMAGGPQVTNTLNVPPPIIPAVPPVLGG